MRGLGKEIERWSELGSSELGRAGGGCHTRPGRSAGGEFERESEMEAGVEWGRWWTDVGQRKTRLRGGGKSGGRR